MDKEKLLRLIQNQHVIPRIRCMLEERDLRKTEYDFDANQLCFLRRISRREGMSQAELANEVMVPPPTVTRKLNRLIQDGIVERRDDSTDYRKKCLYLTEAGEKAAQFVNTMNAAHMSILFDGFTEDEQNQYADFLQRIRNNIENNLKEHP